MHPIEYLRWAGLVAIAVMLIVAAIIQRSMGFDLTDSLSRGWASSRKNFLTMGITLTVCGAVFIASVIGWLIPTYHLTPILYPVAILGYIALLGIAWVPMVDKPGDHSLLHMHFIGGAVVATGALGGFLAILLAEPAVPPVSFGVSFVGFVYAAFWPFFMSERWRRYFLALELGLVALFVITIGALTAGW